MSNSEINMNDSDMNESDFFICAAFQKILEVSATEKLKKLDRKTKSSIADYLTKLPPEDKLNPAAMANHITEFCEKPGNEQLNEWLGEIYDRLDTDGIDKLVKKTGDPDDVVDHEFDTQPITKRMLDNEGRDICQYLQKWAIQINEDKTRATKDDNQPAS